MSIDVTASRSFVETPPAYEEIVHPLGLEIPTIGVDDYFALRLLRNGRAIVPLWDGITDATRALELEKPISLTFGLDPKDDDSDAEVELRNFNRWGYRSEDPSLDVDLMIHVDPSPSIGEQSWEKANVATWMGLLIGRDLQTEDGLDTMLDRFKNGKNHGKIASWLVHLGVVGGNSALQAASLSTALSVASWGGFGVSLIGTTLYRARINNKIERVEDDPTAIVELTDTEYSDEAQELFRDHRALVGYELADPQSE